MSEPVKARSALRLRAVMSLIALPVALIAGVILLAVAPGSGEDRAPYVVAAIICFAVVVIAAVDLVVIARRVKQEPRRRG
ncbi:MAG TPA: DUF6343 family protein [Actinomycetes bacterium]|nr:DUF6343 family protein [Actinomycetes bacterium]